MHKTRDMILISLFAALTAIGAFIQIPLGFYPIPMTLQTFFVFLAGFCLKPKAAMYSQLIYVLLGLLGIPIFTKGGGIHYVLDLMFGYLLSFVMTAPLLSLSAQKYWRVKCLKARFFICVFFSILFMEIVGVAYMALISGIYLGEPFSFERAVYLFLIMLPLDLVKCACGLPLSAQIKKRLPSLRA